MTDEKSIRMLLDKLSKIRQLLEILTRNTLKEELEKIATMDERKRIWAIKKLRKVALITTEKRDYPKRRFDFIPLDWDFEMR